jgi:hypothetical protein
MRLNIARSKDLCRVRMLGAPAALRLFKATLIAELYSG